MYNNYNVDISDLQFGIKKIGIKTVLSDLRLQCTLCKQIHNISKIEQ